MVTEQERARNDIQNRLARGAAGDERFRRQTPRTPKEVVCPEFNVGLLPGNLNLTVLEEFSASLLRRMSRPTILRSPAVQSCTMARMQL
jgi:hypothetical protein